MKTQPVSSKPGNFEDLIFEGRNQAYGAYELTRKRNRYLIAAFLISFAGMATSIGVPFIKSLNVEDQIALADHMTPVILTAVKQRNDVPLPPPKQDLEKFEKTMIRNLKPIVVAEANEEVKFDFDNIDKQENLPPPDVDVISVVPQDNIIPAEPYEEPIDFPTEQASFQGGDINDFRKWISDHITYPAEAAEENIFGRVIIQFCVNKKGEVVELKILRGLHPVLDEATMQVISSSPRWMPAKQGGNPVKTRYIIPVVFDLM